MSEVDTAGVRAEAAFAFVSKEGKTLRDAVANYRKVFE